MLRHFLLVLAVLTCDGRAVAADAPSLALLPPIRNLGEEEVPQAEGKAEPPVEPGLRRSA